MAMQGMQDLGKIAELVAPCVFHAKMAASVN
jgi:hypothetical protein